jgi:hypothetical protein
LLGPRPQKRGTSPPSHANESYQVTGKSPLPLPSS